jgi:hypothetical protein
MRWGRHVASTALCVTIEIAWLNQALRSTSTRIPLKLRTQRVARIPRRQDQLRRRPGSGVATRWRLEDSVGVQPGIPGWQSSSRDLLRVRFLVSSVVIRRVQNP